MWKVTQVRLIKPVTASEMPYIKVRMQKRQAAVIPYPIDLHLTLDEAAGLIQNVSGKLDKVGNQWMVANFGEDGLQ